jgi:hypothetical protein
MNAFATDTMAPDDARAWSRSMIEALPTTLPAQDPVAQMLAEERGDQVLLRLVLSAALAVAVLALACGLLA